MAYGVASRDQERVVALKEKAEKLVRSGKWAKALNVFSEVAQIDSKNDRIMRRIAELHVRLDQKSEATQVYKNLAELYAKNGFWAKAISASKMIQQIDPEDLQVETQIAKLYSKMTKEPVGAQVGIGMDPEKPVRKPSEKPSAETKPVPSTAEAKQQAVAVSPDSVGREIQEADPPGKVDQVAPGSLKAEGQAEPRVSDPQNLDPKIQEKTVPSIEAYSPCIDFGDDETASADAEIDTDSGPAVSPLEESEGVWTLDDDGDVDDVIDLDDSVELPEEEMRIPLFSDFSPEEFQSFVQRLSIRRVQEGQLICEQNKRGESIFILSSGVAEVFVQIEPTATEPNAESDKIKVAELSTGQFFGEFGLLSDGKRHATVRAKTKIELLELTKEDLRLMSEQYPNIPKILSRYYHERIIDTVLQRNPIFHNLPSEVRARVLCQFVKKEVRAGEYLFREGEESADLYFIKAGRFLVSLKRDGDTILIATLEAGSFFGEMALLTGEGRSASVCAETDSEVLCLPAAVGKKILADFPKLQSDLEQISQDRSVDAHEAYQSHQALKRDLALV